MKNSLFTQLTKKGFLFIISLCIAFSIFISGSSTQVFAQTDQPATTYLNELEEEILLNLPIVTENPNYALTFKDPSPDSKGVNLDLDGKGSSQITSPYTLPTLGIGKHTLEFSFFDSEGAAQTLERDLYIIPRTPTINDAILKEGVLTIDGQGLSSSDIEILVSGTSRTLTIYTKTDDKGNWNISRSDITQESEMVITALCRKNGFSSYFAQDVRIAMPVVIDPNTNNSGDGQVQQDTNIKFSFSAINFNNISTIIQNNMDLLYYSIGVLLFGLLIGLIIGALDGKDKTKKSDSAIKSALNINKGELTLKDKLSAVGANVKKLEADQTFTNTSNDTSSTQANSDSAITDDKATETEAVADSTQAVSTDTKVTSTDTLTISSNTQAISTDESAQSTEKATSSEESTSPENVDSNSEVKTEISTTEISANADIVSTEKSEEEKEVKEERINTSDNVSSSNETINENETDKKEEEAQPHKKSFMERLFGTPKKTKEAVEKEAEDLNTQLDGQTIEKDDFLMSFKDFDPDPENGADKNSSEKSSDVSSTVVEDTAQSQSSNTSADKDAESVSDGSQAASDSQTEDTQPNSDVQSDSKDSSEKATEGKETEEIKKEKVSNKKNKKKSSEKKSRNIKITLTSK